MPNFYRVLAIVGLNDKYRSVCADYDTLDEANAAMADPTNVAAWDADKLSIFQTKPSGYEAVQRTA